MGDIYGHIVWLTNVQAAVHHSCPPSLSMTERPDSDIVHCWLSRTRCDMVYCLDLSLRRKTVYLERINSKQQYRKQHKEAATCLRASSHTDDSQKNSTQAACPRSCYDLSTPLHMRSSSFRINSPPHYADHGSDLPPQSPARRYHICIFLPNPTVLYTLDDCEDEENSMRRVLSNFPGPPPPVSARLTQPHMSLST